MKKYIVGLWLLFMTIAANAQNPYIKLNYINEFLEESIQLTPEINYPMVYFKASDRYINEENRQLDVTEELMLYDISRKLSNLSIVWIQPVDVHFESNENGIIGGYIIFSVDENTSDKGRYVRFINKNMGSIITIEQLSRQTAPQIYNSSINSTTIFPGKMSEIILDGSEIGVEYKLKCIENNSYIISKQGTGSSVVFKAALGPLTYCIEAKKGTVIMEMNNRFKLSYHDLLIHGFNTSPYEQTEGLNPNGGQLKIKADIISQIYSN